MKNILRLNLLMVLIFAMLFPGCKDHSSKNPEHVSRRIFISSFMTMHDPFFVELNEGIRKAVTVKGDSLVFLDGEHSREKQEKDIVEMLKKDIAGKPVDKDVRVPVKLVTKENAEEFIK